MLAVVPAMTPVAMGLSGLPVYPAARPPWPARRAGRRRGTVAHSGTCPARDALAIRQIGAALIAEEPVRYLTAVAARPPDREEILCRARQISPLSPLRNSTPRTRTKQFAFISAFCCRVSGR